jgi:hypothetical protein
MRMAEEVEVVLKVSTGQPLRSVDVEQKGLTLRMVDKLEGVVSLVAGMVEEVVEASKEAERRGKQLGEKVESVLEGKWREGSC